MNFCLFLYIINAVAKPNKKIALMKQECFLQLDFYLTRVLPASNLECRFKLSKELFFQISLIYMFLNSKFKSNVF